MSSVNDKVYEINKGEQRDKLIEIYNNKKILHFDLDYNFRHTRNIS